MKLRTRNYIALAIGWSIAILLVLFGNDAGRPGAFWLFGAVSGITMVYVEMRVTNRKILNRDDDTFKVET